MSDRPLKHMEAALNATFEIMELQEGDVLVVTIKDTATSIQVQRLGMSLSKIMETRSNIDCIIVPNGRATVERFDPEQMRKLGWIRQECTDD